MSNIYKGKNVLVTVQDALQAALEIFDPGNTTMAKYPNDGKPYEIKPNFEHEKNEATHWRLKDGSLIQVKDMSDAHLINAMRILENRWLLGSGGPGPNPGYLYPIYKTMMAEATKRKLAADLFCTICQDTHVRKNSPCKTVWCETCNKKHPVPKNKHHQKALYCHAPDLNSFLPEKPPKGTRWGHIAKELRSKK